MTAATSAPDWFRKALDQRPAHHDLIVEGANVHYRVWGEPGPDTVVLVHGAGGHLGWWDHVAPLLCRPAVAIDLTGHGDSDRRPSYALAQWAREIRAVAATVGVDSPQLVGHSMGGRVAVAAALAGPTTSVACVDSPVRPVSAERTDAHSPSRPPAVYPDREVALARFRTIPSQDALPFVRRHVAEESLRAVEGGWTWKVDVRVFGLPPTLHTLLARLDPRVPVCFLRSEYGVVEEDMLRLLREARPGVRLLELPAAGHHPMLDRPLELVTALRATLSLQLGDADVARTAPSTL